MATQQLNVSSLLNETDYGQQKHFMLINFLLLLYSLPNGQFVKPVCAIGPAKHMGPVSQRLLKIKVTLNLRISRKLRTLNLRISRKLRTYLAPEAGCTKPPLERTSFIKGRSFVFLLEGHLKMQISQSLL